MHALLPISICALLIKNTTSVIRINFMTGITIHDNCYYNLQRILKIREAITVYEVITIYDNTRFPVNTGG